MDMIEDDEKNIRTEIRGLRTQIRSVEYLIRMEKISRIDRGHPLVLQQEELRARLDKLLVMVRHIRQHKTIRSS